MTQIHENAVDAPENTCATAVPADDTPARPHGDQYIRYATVAVVVALAGVAFFVSFRHLYGLALSYGEAAETARLFPLTIDGLIIAASLVLLYCARTGLGVPLLARLALWLGIGSTIVGNAAHGIAHGWQGALVSATSAVALVIAYELLMGLLRTMRRAAPEPAAVEVVYRDRPIEVEVEREVRVLPADRFEAARWACEEAATAGRRLPGRRALADRFGIEVREAIEILTEVEQPRPEPTLEQLAPEPEVFHPELPAAINGQARTEAV